VWFDFASVEQDDFTELVACINALGLYIAASDAFVSFEHPEYWGRAWCLAEQMFGDAAVLPRYVLTAAGELEALGEGGDGKGPRTQMIDPMEGNLTVESDRAIIEVLVAIARQLRAQLHYGDVSQMWAQEILGQQIEERATEEGDVIALHGMKAASTSFRSGAGGSQVPYRPGPPVSALAAPGSCVFGESWSPAPLLHRSQISHDTVVLRFGLGDPSAPLGLSTCACLLAKIGDDVRPYTPVSTNRMLGQFELMVKVYESGALSSQLSALELGGTVDFKHIPFNVKIQYPFGKARIGMIAGGTGITPMIQALHALLGTRGDATEVFLLYSSKTYDDILARELLDSWAAAHADRLHLTHTLTREPADSAWSGSRGRVDRGLIATHLPPPTADTLLFVCGPPTMYNDLSGARGEAELGGVLAELGYRADQVVKF
jgi:cytochrome-b5 reductase